MIHSELLFTFPSNQNHKDTNFAIGGFLAGLHRSPLIFLCFQDLLATFGNVEDSFSPLIIQALSATVKGVRGMVQYSFWPFLVLHFVVRFSSNHNRTAPYFYGHMCDAVQCGVA